MRIYDSHSRPAVDSPAGSMSGRRIGDHITYFLLRQPPTGSGRRRGPEWLLEAWAGGRRSWTMTLAPCGAGPGATVQVAGAVASRVLAEHAVNVEGWEHLGTDRLPMYLARLRPTGRPAGSRPPPVTDVARSPAPEPGP